MTVPCVNTIMIKAEVVIYSALFLRLFDAAFTIATKTKKHVSKKYRLISI